MSDSSQTEAAALIYRRRSVREYTTERVSRKVVKRLLDAAVHAPTAMHREPWVFAVVQNREVLIRYSNQAKALMLAQQEALHDLSPDASALRQRLQDPAFDIFHGAGTLVVIGYEHHNPFAEADCWLAAQNLMLAATAEGLGSCCIGFSLQVLNVPSVKQELGWSADGAVVAAVVLGVPRSYPDGPGERKPPHVLAWVE